ncbi:hypothetical protein OG21DRAFT_1482560 [Imleria badia]|nr:hypothetical protein OG21DRAFT_1482560 [Imleria badia]
MSSHCRSNTLMYRHTSRLHLPLSLCYPVRIGHYLLSPNLHPCTHFPYPTTADDWEVVSTIYADA